MVQAAVTMVMAADFWSAVQWTPAWGIHQATAAAAAELRDAADRTGSLATVRLTGPVTFLTALRTVFFFGRGGLAGGLALTAACLPSDLAIAGAVSHAVMSRSIGPPAEYWWIAQLVHGAGTSGWP